VRVSQQLDAAGGYVPGGGIYRKRMWVGARQAGFDATIYVDAGNTDIIDDWTSGALLEVSFGLTGDVILNGQPERTRARSSSRRCDSAPRPSRRVATS